MSLTSCRTGTRLRNRNRFFLSWYIEKGLQNLPFDFFFIQIEDWYNLYRTIRRLETHVCENGKRKKKGSSRSPIICFSARLLLGLSPSLEAVRVPTHSIRAELEVTATS